MKEKDKKGRIPPRFDHWSIFQRVRMGGFAAVSWVKLSHKVWRHTHTHPQVWVEVGAGEIESKQERGGRRRKVG